MELEGKVDVTDPRLKTTLRAEHGAQGFDAWTRLDALKEVETKS